MSDFGLTEDMYSSNYYRHDSSETGTQEKVPIKWMAPESIETGRFDERTDVVGTLVSPNNHGIVTFCNPVVIWSDMLGGVYMWRSPVCWCPSHHSTERTPLWTQTGQTQQPSLL